ncbi:MAG: sugar ABC transporter permease, partial [Candidatus Faecousia sp.]|nr:sugar ABC transporter permease [Candidatus Faecousia sp.]
MNSTKLKRQQVHHKLRFTNEDLWGYIFIAAALIIFCVFTLYPVFSAVYTSFFNYKPFGSEFVGLQNYVETLKYSKFNLFYKAALNTLVYTAVVVPLSLLMSFCIAIMILPFKKKTQSVFKAM